MEDMRFGFNMILQGSQTLLPRASLDGELQLIDRQDNGYYGIEAATALVKIDIKPGDSRIAPTFDVCIFCLSGNEIRPGREDRVCKDINRKRASS
jgi:hypothetical protein